MSTIDEIQIEGFDPLSVQSEQADVWKDIAEQKVKSDIRNILLSYTGTFDCFSELLQNSLDSVERRQREQGESFRPKIWITIDVSKSIVEVIDNGIGMSRREFLLLPTPNVSGKRRKELRGNKGVGATFLSYGFTHIRIDSKRDGAAYAASLSNGRAWAEDTSGNVARPVFHEETFAVPELEQEESGARVRIHIGSHPQERPNLAWLLTDTANDWLEILQIKTPLGQVYMETPRILPHVKVQVISQQGTISKKETDSAQYPFPHEITDVFPKAIDLDELKIEVDKVIDPATRRKKDALLKVAPKYRKLDLIWNIWDPKKIASETASGQIGFDISARQMELIELHSAHVYGAFVRSSTLWDHVRGRVKLHGNVKLLSGGLQIASDCMVQGDLMTIPLTSAAGYQDFAHIIVHFNDGDPDVGRKKFQPELQDLAESLAKNAVTQFRDYYAFLGTNSSGRQSTNSSDLYNWKKGQEEYANLHPLGLTHVPSVDNTHRVPLAYISQPQEEQDVVAIFHELIGLRALRGYRFFATAGRDRYDCLFRQRTFDDEDVFYRSDNRLGISSTVQADRETEPRVLEYKLDFKGLVDDVNRDIKAYGDIEVLVCWALTNIPSSRLEIESLLVGSEGSTRQYFGSTHRAVPIDSSQVAFEVICLQDLLEFLANPESVIARHKSLYS